MSEPCPRHPFFPAEDCQRCERQAEDRDFAERHVDIPDDEGADAAADRYEKWLESCWP